MKFPFDFSLKLIFRLIFPGIILAAAMVPAVHAALRGAGLPVRLEFAFPFEVVAWGWVIIVCDMFIYMLFEGRRYWPARLRKLFVWLETRRLNRLHDRVYNNPIDSREYLEASVEYGNYPIDDDGARQVWYPTRLGNILAEYEDYPDKKFGLDSVFHWYRLWVVLDKDLREEIDNAQSVVDSALYVSFVLYLSGLIMFLYAAIGFLQKVSLYDFPLLPYLYFVHLPYLPSSMILIVMGVACIVSGFLLYRVSLPAHSRFGELFKSIFDMYRMKLVFDDVVAVASEISHNPSLVTRSSKEKNDIAFMYLQWHSIWDEATGEYLTVGEWRRRSSPPDMTASPPDMPQASPP